MFYCVRTEAIMFEVQRVYPLWPITRRAFNINGCRCCNNTLFSSLEATIFLERRISYYSSSRNRLFLVERVTVGPVKSLCFT